MIQFVNMRGKSKTVVQTEKELERGDTPGHANLDTVDNRVYIYEADPDFGGSGVVALKRSEALRLAAFINEVFAKNS